MHGSHVVVEGLEVSPADRALLLGLEVSPLDVRPYVRSEWMQKIKLFGWKNEVTARKMSQFDLY